MSYKTNLGKNKREQLKSRMDDFTSFWWANHNMFEEFGAFIVGGKDALKFYNGSNFTNQYAKPQFEGASPLLTGVNFDIQKIEFTMGVYWFTIEEYRELLNLLHPYEVNDLVFGFADKWRYLVKLNSRKDSTRYFLEYDKDGNARYYTEIKLTFEVQGDSCAQARTEYGFKLTEVSTVPSGKNWILATYGFESNMFLDKNVLSTDLDTPFHFSFAIDLTEMNSPLFPSEELDPDINLLPKGITTEGYYIVLGAKIPVSISNMEQTNYNEVGLCSIYLNHLSPFDESLSDVGATKLIFTYHSDTGLLTLKIGDTEKIVSLLSSAGTGTRIVQALETQKCYLPGRLTQGVSTEQFNEIQFYLSYTSNLALVDVALESYARTNVI